MPPGQLKIRSINLDLGAVTQPTPWVRLLFNVLAMAVAPKPVSTLVSNNLGGPGPCFPVAT